MVQKQEKLTTIRLSGQLGKKFGHTHRFYVSNPAEAVRALSSQVNGFKEYLADESNKTLYKVFVADRQINPEEELHLGSGSKEIRISPVVQGAKRGGIFQVVLGAALIALSFVPGLNVAIWSGASATWASLSLSMGVGLVLGGVAQLLSPQPKMNTFDPPENSPNSSFSGPVNTIGSGGHPVPLAYGEVICGSATISAGMYASDINR